MMKRVVMNYQAGVGTMSELMESEAMLLMAENAYTDARITCPSVQRNFRITTNSDLEKHNKWCQPWGKHAQK